MTKPEFLTNAPDAAEPVTVARTLSEYLTSTSENRIVKPPLAISTAYFNVGGFTLLEDALHGLSAVRLLLGSDPTDAEVRTTITPLHVRGSNKRHPELDAALTEHAHALAEDRDLLGFGREPDAAAERLISWLESGRVQVRRLENGFLHGKAFILGDQNGGAIAGSSNFTYAGLAKNRELNLGVHAPSAVGPVLGWFEDQWEQAVDYDLAALYKARRVPHRPDHVFLRMLHALYGESLDADLNTYNELGLSQFQIDGVARARRILAKRRGVVVADEVGLGKTYIAGELIREAAIDRRQKVLVVAPATLRDSTWLPALKQWNVPAVVRSYEEIVQNHLTRGRSPAHPIGDPNEYAMVVVDEAHNLRNSDTIRADAMRWLTGGSVPKDLVLLTATPVNNSLRDLQTLVGYIASGDSEFADVGIPSVAEYIKRAMDIDPDDLTGTHLFELIDAITVRRTRHFIQTQYPGALVAGKAIVFPQPVLDTIRYKLDDVLPGFFGDLATALGAHEDDSPSPDVASVVTEATSQPGVLTMARYVPSRYLLSTVGEEQYQVQNAGLLKSALLKRFESSAAAFAKTVRTMVASHNQFLSALDNGYVLIGDALREWIATDTDDVAGFVAELDGEARDGATSAALYDVAALRDAVESDRDLLTGFAQKVETLTWRDDPKIAALREKLALIAASASAAGLDPREVRDKRKVLLFTYFADTATYVNDALAQIVQEDERLADYRGRIVMATGADRKERQKAIEGFSPRTASAAGARSPDSADTYDLAVATDVLAEGVNLQQAGQIINYDLPWNPMRLVQRHGRIDRIGSQHTHIYLRSFFPDDRLEELLGLEARLQMKLKTAGAAFGTAAVIAGVDGVERSLSETREEIERLLAEDTDAFQALTASATASSEEFQRRLAKGFASAQTKREVLALPWGAGTGLRRRGSTPGVAFCIQVADRARPLFRYVPFEHITKGLDGTDLAESRYEVRRQDGKPEIDRSTLVSLLQADPGEPSLDADLPSELLDAVYRAWPLARADVFEDWEAQTDPATFDSAVPKVMRDAADLVARHGGRFEKQAQLERRLRQTVEPRNQRAVREVLREHEGSPDECVKALQTIADDLRLKEPVPVEPLPEIELEDVRLLAWAAVHGEPQPRRA